MDQPSLTITNSSIATSNAAAAIAKKNSDLFERKQKQGTDSAQKRGGTAAYGGNKS